MEKVLFTRKLKYWEIFWSYFNGIRPVAKGVVKTKRIKLSKENRNLLSSNNYKYYVFSSANAVKYFKRHYRFWKFNAPSKNVQFIALGEKTAKRLKGFENKVHVYRPSELIRFDQYIHDLVNESAYLFFGSDIASIKWNWDTGHENGRTIEIYQNISFMNQIKPNKFKRVVFESSSAVNAFFQRNKNISEQVVCYTIGEPTRTALSNYFKGDIWKPENINFISIVRSIKQSMVA